MQAIQAPIKPGESGPQVANLQDGLRLLFERGVIRSLDPPDSPTAKQLAQFAQVLGDERTQSLYAKATQRLVQIVQIQQDLGDSLGGVVDDGTADLLNRLLKELGAFDAAGADEFVVKGRVTQVGGAPAPGLTVRALDRDLRTFEPLGNEVVTDANGRYEIRYSRGQSSRAEKDNADLLIRVLSPNSTSDQDRPLIESHTMFNAPAVAEIDLQVPHMELRLSEYERHLDAITPLLVGQADDGDDLPIAALTERDVDFIANDSGIAPQHIAMLAQAAQFEIETRQINSDIHTHVAYRYIPAAAFYGWLRLDLPTDVEKLSAQPVEKLQSSLELAAQLNTVPAAVGERATEYARQLFSRRVHKIVGSASDGGKSERDPWLVRIRRSLGPDQFANFADAYAVHGSDVEALSTSLIRIGLGAQDIARASHVLILKSMSRDHAPLLEAVEQAAATDGRWNDPKGLAAFDVADWRKVLDSSTSAGSRVGAPSDTPGDTPEAKLDNYARILTAEVEARLPNESFQERALRDLDNPDREIPQGRRQDWLRFFKANPDFDIRTTKLKDLLGDDTERDHRFEGVTDRETLVQDLESIQRVFRLVPEPKAVSAGPEQGPALTDRYSPVVALIERGYHSATKVLKDPKRVFEVELASPLGGPVVAKHVYMRAAYVGDAALLALMNARSLSDAASPAFVNAADYQTLFGDGDLCDCEHCRSFLGPAAYFVDTLQFLREAGDGNDPQAPWSLLNARRPDLKRIALSCANANTELPYIDIVNEVLEEAVAPTAFAPFTVAANLMFSISWDGSSWAGWSPLGDRPFNSGPAAASTGPNRLDVFARGTDDTLYTISWAGSSWSTWRQLGPQPISSDPAAVAWGPGRIDVFARGTDNRMYTISWDGSTWTGWSPLGDSLFKSGPAVASMGPDRLDVFARSTDDTLYTISWTGSSWSAWRQLAPQPISSDPAAVAWGPGRIDVFARGTDNRMYKISWVGSSWTGWSLLGGGLFNSGPAVASMAPNRLDVFARSTDDTLHTISWNGSSWSTWRQVAPEPISSDPAAVAWGPGRIDVFARGTNNVGFNPVTDLDARSVTQGIRSAFKDSANAIELSSEAEIFLLQDTVLSERHFKKWFITDGGYLYSVSNNGENASVQVIARSRQTSGVSEELMAAPEYINRGAYAKLKASTFPWSLPLDLDWEETRALLDQGGLSRQDALVAFAVLGTNGVTPIAALESLPAVSECLGMPLAEADIVQSPLVGASLDKFWTQFWPTLAVIPSVAMLIERTGLTYVDLVQLLETRFLNPAAGVGRKLSVVPIDLTAPATCDQTKLAVAGFDAATLDRLHRFVRLWRRLGWAIRDLDVVLRSLSAPDITSDVLVALSHVERLRQSLKLPLEHIAAFFGDVDTVSWRNPSDEGPRPLQSLYERVFRARLGQDVLDPAFVEDPALLQGSVEDHLPGIRAALALDERAVLALTASALRGAAPHSLTLANLSRLFRYAALARGLGLAQNDLVRVMALVAKVPFATGTLGNAATGPRVTWQLVEAVSRLRATGLAIDELEYILASLPEVDARLGRSDADVQSVLDELRRAMLDVGTEEQTADQVLAQRNERLIQGLAHASGMGPLTIAAVKPAWTSLLQSLTTSGKPAPLEGSAAIRLLDKLAKLLQFTQLPDDEAAWLCTNAALLELPSSLNLSSAGSPALTFSAFEGLLDYLEARRAAVNPHLPLYGVIESPDLSHFIDALVDVTGWSKDDVRWSLPANADPVQSPPKPSTYAHMKRAFELARRVGASAEAVALIVANTDAEALNRLVRARRDRASWLAVSKPLADRLRERRRDALVDYLLHVRPRGLPPAVRTADDLYAHYLTDIEMSSCMRTSRIKNAVSTTQLFIQRCLMGLEFGLNGKAVQLEPSKASEWTEWRSIYRIWEANRKVFLYPENWVEPELRETKSPFFRELESELGQAELTQESAERALQAYLDKLATVSNLEPVAIHRDPQGQGELLHIVARTTSLPHVHWYRRRSKLDSTDLGRWTPWERVEMELDSEHLILLMLHGRLRLYWASVRDASPPQEGAGLAPKAAWGITFYWSEYDAGRWSRRHQLKLDKPLTVVTVTQRPPGEVISFRARVSTYGIFLDCHIADDFKPKQLDSRPDPVPSDEFNTLLKGTPLIKGWVVDKVGHLLAGASLQYRITRVVVPETGLATERVLKGQSPGRSNVEEPFSWDMQIHRDVSKDGTFSLHLPEDYSSWATNEPKAMVHWEIEASYAILDSSGIHYDQFSFKANGIFNISVYKGEMTFYRVIPIDCTLKPEDSTDLAWRLVNTIGIDIADCGSHIPSASGPPISPPMGTRVFGMAYCYEGSGNRFVLGKQESRVQSGGKLVPMACLDQAGTEGDLFAYSEPGSFVLIEEGVGGVASTVLSPTLALGLREHASVQGPIGLYEIGYTPAAQSQSAWTPDDRSLTRPFDRKSVDQVYYWEVFFHIPFIIANRLSRNRRFADARRWLHCIFDPTQHSTTGPERFWIAPPLRDLAKSRPGEVRALLPVHDADLTEQVDAMRRDPFRPHAIASLRIAAYMRATFFLYVDLLVEWGDNSFRRETMESLNEATQFYVLAHRLVGKRPQQVPPRALPSPQTFESLTSNLSFNRTGLANAEVEIGELLMPDLTSLPAPSPYLGSVALFCFPKNDKLGKYQDTIEDRLYKVRHCKDIEGRALLLSLWDVPIDPALLVRATAAGLDLQQILDELTGPSPHFRFNLLVQKANELCAEVKSFGAALLSALEKRDAELLGRLRTRHEVELLERVRAVKQAQLQEAQRSKAALEKSLALTEARGEHYAQLLRTSRQTLPAVGAEGGLEALAVTVGAPAMKAAEGTVMMQQESQDFEAMAEAQIGQSAAGTWEVAAAIAHPLSASITYNLSAPYPSPTISVNLGQAFSAVAASWRAYATGKGAESTRLSKQASLVLRAYDWALQLKLAARERTQIEAQILTAEIREAIATTEIANHEQQIEASRDVEQFLRDKYTNEQLYEWTAAEISRLYFSSYRLAQGMAQRAEKASQRELGSTSPSVIRNDHWDSYHSGLLAGERLSQDLKRLEVAYLDGCERRFEITKHVSLARVSPKELMKLRETGHCSFDLSEELFDTDYRDHQLRRIKAVAVSIPAVTGPYTSVNCKLSLTSSSVRQGTAEPVKETVARDTIVTSTGANDSGLFEQNLRDERFQPFEGAGAISTWNIDLELSQNAFDLTKIADFILHLRYTAIDGDKRPIPKGQRFCLFDLKRDFPDAWRLWKSDAAATKPLTVKIDKDRLPFTIGVPEKINAVGLYARVSPDPLRATVIRVLAGNPAVMNVPSTPPGIGDAYGELLYEEGTPIPASDDLKIEVGTPSIRADVEDLYLICSYERA